MPKFEEFFLADKDKKFRGCTFRWDREDGVVLSAQNLNAEDALIYCEFVCDYLKKIIGGHYD